MRTVEGTSWPIVLMAELVGARPEAWRRALEEANVIVLAEGSLLRAAVVIASERPHVVLVAAAVPLERTQTVRDAARDAGSELLEVPQDLSPDELCARVEAAVARVVASRSAPRR